MVSGTAACNDHICGAGIIILLFSPKTGWITIYKKCGPVPGNNSLDAELGGCAMLIENLHIWLRKGWENVLKSIINDLMTYCIVYSSTPYCASLSCLAPRTSKLLCIIRRDHCVPHNPPPCQWLSCGAWFSGRFRFTT